MTTHRRIGLHWVPPENWHGQIGEHAITACGKDIDGSCDAHLASGEPCHYGLAWTRSRDLDSYKRRPYEQWPSPCPVCKNATMVARLESVS